MCYSKSLGQPGQFEAVIKSGEIASKENDCHGRILAIKKKSLKVFLLMGFPVPAQKHLASTSHGDEGPSVAF